MGNVRFPISGAEESGKRRAGVRLNAIKPSDYAMSNINT